MEKKNLIPIIVVAAIVVLGGAALWYSMNRSASDTTAPEIAPVPVLSTTSDAGAPSAAVPGKATLPDAPPNLPAGSIVTGRTVWQGKTADNWKIAFSVASGWKLQTLSVKGSTDIAQITGGDDTTTYFVSRNIRINEPSGLTYSTKKITVAGKSILAHVYDKPNATSAFYEYFTLPVAGDTYYFRLESKAASTKVADDFISLVVIK